MKNWNTLLINVKRLLIYLWIYLKRLIHLMSKWVWFSFSVMKNRSSRPENFYKKGVLRNFTKLTGEHLCQGLFFNKVAGLRPATRLEKRLWHRCFPVNFVKFLRTPFYIKHLWWLLLKICVKLFFGAIAKDEKANVVKYYWGSHRVNPRSPFIQHFHQWHFLFCTISLYKALQSHTKSIVKATNHKLNALIRVALLMADLNKKIMYSTSFLKEVHLLSLTLDV